MATRALQLAELRFLGLVGSDDDAHTEPARVPA